MALGCAAGLALAGCGGGGSGGGSVNLSPVFSGGNTSSSAVPLTPAAPVQALGGAKFSSMTLATSFPALSVTTSGFTGPNASLSAPTFDLTGATMKITIDPSASIAVSKSLGGTTYTDTYTTGTFGLDAWFVFKELPVAGLTNATSDFVFYSPAFVSDVLEYTQLGFWSRDTASDAANTIFSPYVIGYVTPAGSVPGAGSASYTGRTLGIAVLTGTDGAYLLRGNVAATANFAAGTVATSFTDIVASNSLTGAGAYFSNFGGTANIAGNTFSGPLASTATAGTPLLVNTNALTGTVNGQFYGPGVEEIGGVWALTGGGWNAAGSFGGQQ